ncbi:hypothetical protein TgHK011_006034 [Trichoderma gracile]|nr:hypothetical protein TgHK011_006034 [Trichoderma gracile]
MRGAFHLFPPPAQLLPADSLFYPLLCRSTIRHLSRSAPYFWPTLERMSLEVHVSVAQKQRLSAACSSDPA